MIRSWSNADRRLIGGLAGAVLAGWAGAAVAVPAQPASTQPPSLQSTDARIVTDPAPLDLSLYEQSQCAYAPGSSIAGVKHTAIDQAQLTLPSLWWTQEQFVYRAADKALLIDGWIACPGRAAQPGRVDLLVNLQLWSLLTYLERYQFLNEFGAATSQEGYNLRVFNREAARSVCPAGYQRPTTPTTLNPGAASAGMGSPSAAPCVCLNWDQCPTPTASLINQVAFEQRLAAYSCNFAAISTAISCQIEDTARKSGLRRDATGGFSPTGPDNPRSPWR